MASDDEFRRVAEDVRALARSLARDLRIAFDQARDEFTRPSSGSNLRSARDDLAAAGRAARRELRHARSNFRPPARPYVFPEAPPPDPADRLDVGGDGYDADEPVSPATRTADGCPRFDNWGGGRYRGRPPRRAGWAGPAGWWDAPGGVVSAGDAPIAGLAARPRSRPATSAERQALSPAKAAPPLRHRRDGSTLLGLLALVFGLAGLAAATDVAHVSGEVVAAVALMVLGATMVVTARTDWALSRRSWPIFGGVVLGVALVVFAVVPALPVGFRHVRFGSTATGYTTWAEVPARIEAGAGRNVIDLSGIQEALSAPRTLKVANGAGSIVIDVPVSLRVRLHASVVAGSIQVLGQTSSGLGRVVDQPFGPTTGYSLTLQVQAGFGQVVVNQGPVDTVSAKPVPAPPKVPSP